jgi:transposase
MQHDWAQVVEDLHRQLAELKAENERLRTRIKQLEDENRHLRDQLEQAQTAAMRQAAPFRRETRQKVPDALKKPPGQKPGHPGHCRAVPDHIDETVEVPLSQCPQCGGPVDTPERIEQIIEEIPPVSPHVVKVITYRAHCRHCGWVRTVHPLQTSEAQGAAQVQLGPRALALGACLNKVHGVTMRTTCRVLKDLCGLRLTAGGLSHALRRIARRMQGTYDRLIETLRRRPAVFADETSWWVGGPGWWLWVFTTAQETVYHVDQHRGSAVVTELLGTDFAGMLVSDCLNSYDPATCAKHKCIAHHLRAISQALTRPGTDDPQYLLRWQSFFHGVIALYRLRETLRVEDFVHKRQAMEQWCDELLAQPRGQPGDVAIRNRLLKQRPHLLGCLYEPAAEPTNNRAERALRPAVIARKLSCGNKTPAGRDCWQVLASLGATCHQQAIDFVSYLAARLSLASATG